MKGEVPKLVNGGPTLTKDMASAGIKSKSDIIYRRLLLSKFFTGGWGEIDTYKRLADFRGKLLSNRQQFNEYVPSSYPVHLEKSWSRESCYIVEGRFQSPLAKHMEGLLPKESEEARFQVVIPKRWPRKDRKPMCVHLAGTGDHFFWRRRSLMAKPLVSESAIASVILENPYYGVRKPKDQLRSSLKYVSDLFVMGAALILESMVLLRWCEKQGYGPLAVSGISMGGHMASIAATAWPKPLGIIPCLSWSTASCVFTQGVMSRSCSWKKLEDQLFGDKFREQLLAEVRQLGVHSFKHLEDAYQERVLTDHLQSPVEHLYGETKPYVLEASKHEHLDMSQTISLDSKSVKQQVYNNFKEAVLEYVPSAFGKNKNRSDPSRRQETVDFMNYHMDESTHLRNYPIPIDPSLATFVTATHDAYIPRDKIETPCNIWNGCQVRYVNAGHVAASLKHNDVFRRAIRDTLDRMT